MIERLLSKFGYVKQNSRVWDTDAPGRRDDNDLARANRWITFYNEDGGLRDMIISIRQGYFEKVGSLKPGDVESLQALGMADKIARELDSRVKQIIDAGKLEKMQREHANKVANLSEAKRRRI